MKLREIRERRGLTQRQAALGLNLSPTVYNRYENGIREPSNVILLAMADFFGVSVDEILGRESVVSTEPWNPDDMMWAVKQDESIRLMARGMSKMTPENRQKILDVARTLFAADFDEQGNRKNDPGL